MDGGFGETPPEGLREFYEALRRFHETWRADQAAGRVQGVRHYQRMFPGHEGAVAAEYARLRAEDPPVEIPTPASHTVARLRQGANARFRSIEEVARGGMGTVIRVRDEILHRDLAMKQCLGDLPDVPGRPGVEGGDPASTTGVRRFVQEAQVTAQLDHPGVVPVHDLGVDAEGRVFFTMKLVRGRTLTEIIRLVRAGAEGWTLTRAVQVFIRLCETMAFAHSKGVIHRDLKPPNVMVGAFGEVYVMDWGLAKLLRGGRHVEPPSSTVTLDRAAAPASVAPEAGEPITLAGAVVGTPQYMSLEQACGLVDALDARTDVYSIGAMLYQLLTGVPPYADSERPSSPKEVLAAIREGPPRSVRSLARDASPELEAVVARAMARMPGDRYASAHELGEDLHRWIEGRVVLAYRHGPVVELRKWVGRNRTAAGILAGAVALAVAGAGAVAVRERAVADRLVEENAKVVAARDIAAAARDVADRERERAVAEARRADGVRLSLQSRSVAPVDAELGLLLAVAAAERDPAPASTSALYGALEHHRESVRLEGHDGYVQQVEFSPDGGLLVSREWGTMAIVWDVAAARLLHRLDEHEGELTHVAFDALGARVVTSSFDGTARVWNAATGRCTAVLRGHGAAVARAVFSPDGRLVATASDDGTARVFDAVSGAPVRLLEGHGRGVHSVAFRPDGGEILTASTDGTARTWDAATGAPRLVLRFGPAADLPAASFPRVRTAWPEVSAEATYAAGADRILAWFPGSARVFDAATGEPLVGFGAPGVPAGAVASPEYRVDRARLHPGGRLLALALRTPAAPGEDPGVLRGVFDIAAGRWVWREEGGPASVAIDFAPDGRRLAEARIWSNAVTLATTATGRGEGVLAGHRYHVNHVRFGPDGTRLATGGCDFAVVLWTVARPWVRRFPAGLPGVQAISPDASAAFRVLPRRDGAVLAEVADTLEQAPPRLLATLPPGSLADAHFPRRTNLVVFHTREGPDGPEARSTMRTLERATLRETGPPVALPPPGWSVAGISDDASKMMAWRTGEASRVYDLARPDHPPVALDDAGLPLAWIAFDADGGRVLTAHGEASIALIMDAATGRRLHRLGGHGGFVASVAWAADGRHAATAAVERKVRLWDAATGAPVCVMEGFPAGVLTPAFHRDEPVLVVAHRDGADLYDIRDLASPVLRGRVPVVCDEHRPSAWFAPDGRLVTLSGDREIRLWPADPLAEARARLRRSLSPAEMVRYEVGTEADREAARDAARREDDVSARRLGRSARDLALAGRFTDALERANRAVAMRPNAGMTHYVRASVLAMRAAAAPAGSAARAADVDGALESLGRAAALDARDPGSPVEVVPGSDPEFEILRADPRYPAAARGGR